eukprot:923587-Pleurochrysis_carterae.AAC.1
MRLEGNAERQGTWVELEAYHLGVALGWPHDILLRIGFLRMCATTGRVVGALANAKRPGFCVVDASTALSAKRLREIHASFFDEAGAGPLAPTAAAPFAAGVAQDAAPAVDANDGARGEAGVDVDGCVDGDGAQLRHRAL